MTAKHVEELKDCLGLNEFASKKAAKARKRKNKKLRKQTENRIVHTLASASKQKDKDSVPEVVKFVSHKSKKKVAAADSDEEDGQDLVSLDQVRHEIFKFGLNALSTKERNDAKVALAIKLGAKPPKNKCIPLQELKEKRQQEKEETKRRQEENESKLINKPNHQIQKKKKGPKKSGGSNKKSEKGMKPKIGSFDGGMLKISNHEIKKMKTKRK